MNGKPITTYTGRLTTQEGSDLQRYLRDKGYTFRSVPHAHFAAAKDQVNLVYYESKKLVIQGKGTQEFVEFFLEPEILKKAELGYEELRHPEIYLPRLGIDESGKGDFFGPLCIAGVYVNESVVKTWKNVGIRDSKAIKSPQRIATLAEAIQKTPGCVSTVVPIGNEAYNRLFKQMGSVNAILAWGHARVIENLMLLRYQMKPEPVRAISDQFASSKSTVAQAIMSLGREIELVQKHKAESDQAVAAASILARHEFLRRLDKLGREYDLTLPKGASPQVEKAASELVEKKGTEVLGKVAKTHFRTTCRVLGMPEPPKRKWQSKIKKPSCD